MPDELLNLTIDGTPISVPKGTLLIEAAKQAGVLVPHYCYHPGLPVAGVCRMCLVEVEKTPKLQIACNTPVAEGMVVHTQSGMAKAGRQGVLELLLINHPLDCPICDQAGECELQDFVFQEGRPGTRYAEYPKRFNPVEDFGPDVLYVPNRCILCTRCVRFMRDVDQDAQINVIDRGYGSEIATFQDEGVHSLLSGNLMDVCPVGAITTRDYRFKSRPWDNPIATDTICTLCSKGCNITAWVKAKPEWAKGSQLIRFTPRLNPQINGYWMCDIGRFDYHWIEGDDRLRRPLVRIDGGAHQPMSWLEVVPKVKERLEAFKTSAPGSLAFLISAHASHEELFLFRRLSESLTGSIQVTWRVSPKQQPADSTFKVSPVDAPNVNGARLFELVPGMVGDPQGPPDLTRLEAACREGRVAGLYVFDPGPAGSLGDVDWVLDLRRAGRLPLLIVQGTVYGELARAADFVLPGATYVEKHASYSNDQGVLQAAVRTLNPPGEARDDWTILGMLGTALGLSLEYAGVERIRENIAAEANGKAALASITTLGLGRPVTARHWLQASNPSERWKWDFMFQDLPPVKGAVDPQSLPMPPGSIPLKPVK
jgi:NADH-quinone oxidoreductase subunit G